MFKSCSCQKFPRYFKALLRTIATATNFVAILHVLQGAAQNIFSQFSAALRMLNGSRIAYQSQPLGAAAS
jgi:hypothetical protein